MAKYRVIYGESMPAWHADCNGETEVLELVATLLRTGDVIYGIFDTQYPRPDQIPVAFNEEKSNG